MSKHIGASFAYYVKHFADMEALSSLNSWHPPKGVDAHVWRMVREVSSAASSQATALLKKLRKVMTDTFGADLVWEEDQRQTLTRDWTIRSGLRARPKEGLIIQAGFAIDVVVDGDARLYLWLLPYWTRRTTQRRLIDVLSGLGVGARPPPTAGWEPQEFVVLAELKLDESATTDACLSWAEGVVRKDLKGHWDQIQAVLAE